MPSRISRKLFFAGQARIARTLEDHSGTGFSKVLELVRDSDLAFTNFENTINGRYGGFQFKTGYPVPPGPEVLDSLAWMGFKALSLANNHAFDLGVGGVLSTLQKAEACGFLHAGLGADESAASAPGYLATQGCTYALVAADAGASKEASRALDASGTSPARPGVNRIGATRILRLGLDDYRNLRRMAREAGHETRRAARVRMGFDQELEKGFDFFGLRVEPEGLETGELETGGLETGGLETGGLETGELETGGLETGELETGGLETGTLETGNG
jgi:poly-gamma-glutamate capsule biosynthesis protein CapA/YwtB (metallophosphatase superfamily)